MGVEKVTPVVPVNNMAAAVAAWSAALGTEPTFVDGDRWAQFDVGGSRIALAGTDRASDDPGLMIKVDDAAATRDSYAAAGADVGELTGAVAAQALACLKAFPTDPDRLNVNGGAIALGHPLGCTGAKLTTTLLYELQRRKGRYGMVTMCVGGGMGAAGIFERM